MNKLKIEITSNPKPEDLEVLTQGLAVDAKVKKGQENVKIYTCFLKNGKNEVKGGIKAVCAYGCLFIDKIWIDAEFRGHGHGKKLMGSVALS